MFQEISCVGQEPKLGEIDKMNDDSDHVLDIINYLLSVANVKKHNQVHQVIDIISSYLTNNDRRNVMSIGEKLIEEGIEKGMEKGIKIGKLSEKEKIAKFMLRSGLDIKFIAQATHLSQARIKALKTEAMV